MFSTLFGGEADTAGDANYTAGVSTEGSHTSPPSQAMSGLPDPATIEKQKTSYMTMLDEQVKQGTAVLDAQVGGFGCGRTGSRKCYVVSGGREFVLLFVLSYCCSCLHCCSTLWLVSGRRTKK